MLVLMLLLSTPGLPSLVLSVQGCCYNQLVMYNFTCFMQRIHCQYPVYYYVSHCWKSCSGAKLFQQQCDDGAVYRLWGLLTRHVATTFTFELIAHILTIPILSAFLYIPSLYASILKSIGFFLPIYLLSFLYTLSVNH